MRKNNTTEAALLLTGATVIAALNHLNSEEAQLKRLKKVVNDVWKNETREDVMKTLELKKKPVLSWDDCDAGVMCVNINYMVREKLWANVITDMDTDYIIHVNLKQLNDSLQFFRKGAMFYNHKFIERTVIKQILQHECRHLWQAQVKKYVGKELYSFDSSFRGYGEKEEEKDANMFARFMVKSDKERVIADLQMKLQEENGKLFSKGAADEKMSYVKAFNPVLNLLSKARFVTIA